jgi:hypothetical protein
MELARRLGWLGARDAAIVEDQIGTAGRLLFRADSFSEVEDVRRPASGPTASPLAPSRQLLLAFRLAAVCVRRRLVARFFDAVLLGHADDRHDEIALGHTDEPHPLRRPSNRADR